MARIAYLGPEGTFTEAALLKLVAAGSVPGGNGIEPLPEVSTPAALEAVRAGAADYACVPIENSIEGSVLPTMDSLAAASPLQIYGELTLDVAFSIVVRPGTKPGQIHTLAAFPVAAAQVRRWLTEHLPNVAVLPANSNAAAAREVADGRCDAGVSTPLAALRYGLATLAEGVVDEPNARTRFVLVGRPGVPPARTGADRTSVVLRIDSSPGALVSALNEFGIRGIEGKLGAIRYARHRGLPLLGLCLGLQCIVIEAARSVGIVAANSAEFEPSTPDPVISTMAGTASRTWPKNSRQTVRVTGGILCSTQREATMRPSVPSFCTPGTPPRNLSVTSLPRPSLRQEAPGSERISSEMNL